MGDSAAGRVIRVAADLADGGQIVFEEDCRLTDREGRPLPLEGVIEALSGPGAYIDYETESRFEPTDPQPWEDAEEGWHPARCRVFGRHVVRVTALYDG